MRTASSAHRGVAVRAMLGGIAAVGLVAGCSTSVDGEPAAQGQTESTGEKTVEWNPCTELSDEVLRAIGVDPASKSTVTDAPTGPVTWRMCQWVAAGQPYNVTVGSSVNTLDESRENPTVTGFKEAQIGPRSGLTFHDRNDPDQLRCYASLPAEQGMFTVIVNWFYSERDSIPQSPPCDLAIQHATELEPYLPK